MTLIQAIILGLVQGITELFPISSLGHAVLVPALLGWHIDQTADTFVVFLVAIHLATALTLLVIFWRDWWAMLLGFFRTIAQRKIEPNDTYGRLIWLIIVGTIPAGLLGLIFQKKLEALFVTPRFVAVVLILNGFLLYGIELVKRQRVRYENLRNTGDVAIARQNWFQALGTGTAQALALIPGFSRTGASLGGGLLSGLDHESAARFSFLLATPIIFAAAALKLPELFHTHYPILPAAAGFVAAAVTATISVKFLLRYFRTNTLTPFAWYCVIAGLISVFILAGK